MRSCEVDSRLDAALVAGDVLLGEPVLLQQVGGVAGAVPRRAAVPVIPVVHRHLGPGLRRNLFVQWLFYKIVHSKSSVDSNTSPNN